MDYVVFVLLESLCSEWILLFIPLEFVFVVEWILLCFSLQEVWCCEWIPLFIQLESLFFECITLFFLPELLCFE